MTYVLEQPTQINLNLRVGSYVVPGPTSLLLDFSLGAVPSNSLAVSSESVGTLTITGNAGSESFGVSPEGVPESLSIQGGKADLLAQKNLFVTGNIGSLQAQGEQGTLSADVVFNLQDLGESDNLSIVGNVPDLVLTSNFVKEAGTGSNLLKGQEGEVQADFVQAGLSGHSSIEGIVSVLFVGADSISDGLPEELWVVGNRGIASGEANEPWKSEILINLEVKRIIPIGLKIKKVCAVTCRKETSINFILNI